MAKMIFVNLPVADVGRATAFYEAIGFEKNPMFSNERDSGMVWSEAIYVMLLDRAFYATFTPKPIANTREVSAALLALSLDDRAAVDAMMAAALAAGGRETRDPQDHGFMYGRAFEDLDGHTFEPYFMDMAAAAQVAAQPEPASA